MIKRWAFIFFCFIVAQNAAFSSTSEPSQEDTLKLNFYTLCCDPETPPVFHGALEGPEAIVGGLGCVVRDLTLELRKSSPNVFSVLPYYSFLKETLPIKYKIHSLGFLDHDLFGRKTTTEVLWSPETGQLLLDPDESIIELSSVVIGRDRIYESSQNYLRLVFFNSALAKLGNFLDAQIVQLHAWQTSLAAPLIKKTYNPLRTKVGKNEIKVISTLHMFSEEQGQDSRRIYKDVGLSKPKDKLINLCATGILESDVLTTVSEGLMTYFYHPSTSYGLDHLFTQKGKFVRGITNGIPFENFSPFSKKNLGPFRLKKPLELEEFTFSKSFAKQYLWARKLIPALDKPLMLYVGRFSDEKGVEFLETIAHDWIVLGGQMVIMGLLTQDQKSTETVLKLKDLTETNEIYHQNLRVYTDLHKDQLAPLSEEIKIQKGKLIRFAADFLCVPSKVESCGLVAMESLAMGTPVFTSWVQGLKDMCFPYGVYHPLIHKTIDHKDFNAVSFHYDKGDPEATRQDVRRNLRLAFRIATGQEFKENDLRAAQIKMISEAKKYDWHSDTGALEKYKALYREISVDETQPSLVPSFFPTLDKDHLVQYLVKKLGIYPTKQLHFLYDKVYSFVLSTLVQGKREKETSFNTPGLKEKTRIVIKENRMYLNDGKILFDTDTLKKDSSFAITWVLSKNGELFCGASCHAFFLKSKRRNPHYGFAKPVACAGDIIVKNGKIIYIDNRSGHYKPNLDQFLLALKYLDSLEILDPKCEIREEDTGPQILISSVRTIEPKDILSKYPTLENLVGPL